LSIEPIEPQLEHYEITPLQDGSYKVRVFAQGTQMWIDLGPRASFEDALVALKEAKEALGQ